MHGRALRSSGCGMGHSLHLGAGKRARRVRLREVVWGLEYKALMEEEVYYPTHREYEAWKKDEGSHYTHPERLYSGGLFSGLAAKDELNRILDVLYGT